MLPKVVKIELPRNAKHEDVVKAVNSKLTRRTTDVLRKSQNTQLCQLRSSRELALYPGNSLRSSHSGNPRTPRNAGARKGSCFGRASQTLGNRLLLWDRGTR